MSFYLELQVVELVPALIGCWKKTKFFFNERGGVSTREIFKYGKLRPVRQRTTRESSLLEIDWLLECFGRLFESLGQFCASFADCLGVWITCEWLCPSIWVLWLLSSGSITMWLLLIMLHKKGELSANLIRLLYCFLQQRERIDLLGGKQ